MLESEPIISKVLRPVVRPDRGPMDDNKHFIDLPKPSLRWPDYEPRLTLWNKVRLVPYILKTFYGVVMRDYRTTVTGIVGAIAYGLNYAFGVVIPQEAIIGLTVWALSYFAGDSKKD